MTELVQGVLIPRERTWPTWEQIEAFKNPLTAGELALAKFLDRWLPPGWDIYVQPFFNGDRPDIVILHPNVGMMIFEVKDWQPEHYHCRDEWFFDGKENQQKLRKRYFVSDRRGTWPIPSPIGQVERYRDNLIELYVPQIGEAIDSDTRNLSAFKTALYFHKMTTQQARQLVPASAGCIVFGKDSLANNLIGEIVPDVNRETSLSMQEGWADKIKPWLQPPAHFIEQGAKLTLNAQQKRHVEPAPHRHQRLRGVAGSGKSLVLAQRAANLAAQGKKVLIVTYNITLSHYVRDLVSRARIGFSWEQVEVIHFHGFCSNFLNENDVPWPSRDEYSDDEILNEIVPQLVTDTISADKNKKGRRYDAILIDEGQDFQQSWYETLCRFLTENDEVLFVVDERQNVYQRNLSWIDAMRGTKFRGRWRELKESYRLPPLIVEQANRFAQTFLPNVGIDSVPNVYQTSFLDPYLIWRNIDTFEEAKAKVGRAFRWLTEEQRKHPSDIVVLVPTHAEGWELVAGLEGGKIRVNHVFESAAKRIHHKKSFWMGDSRLKACTIHSFKGWEVGNVILVTPSDGHRIEDEKLDYVLYTAITRARENLIVFNRRSRYAKYGEGWPKRW